MSKKCRAYSESKLGLEPTDNRKAFYAGWDAALAQQDEPVQEPVAWYRPSIAPDYYAPVFVAGAQPPAPLTQTEARLLGWRPLVPPKAEPVQEPVYWEVRCTAHPKWMRVDEQQFHEYVSYGWEGQRLYTAPPQRKPLAEWQINDLMAGIDPEDVCSWSFRQGVYAAEKHHGVKP